VPSGDFEYVDASMYGEGDGFMYGTTASGDTVTPTSMGVAMRTMPLGTVIEITYGGNTVRAVVNDRGPFVGDRQIDLQPAVAHALGFDGVGTLGFRVVG
jgi:rare lipoprotein A